MIKKFSSLLLLALSIGASAATLNPIQLLNPVGSTAGQAIVSTGAATAPAWANVTATGLVAQAANTVVANATGSSASPTAVPVPNCSGSSSALIYTAGSGFNCNAAINAITLGGATFSAPGPIGSVSTSSGAFSSISTPSATIGGGTINNTAIGGSSASTGAFTTLSSTGAFTPSQTAGIVGTTTNNNANAGSVGEFPTPTNLTGVSLTTGTAANVSSVSLTAGDWEVSGCVYYLLASSTTLTAIVAGINTTSATLPALPGPSVAFLNASFLSGPSSNEMCSPNVRISISSTTTVFLIGQASFATSTVTANGYLRVRRVR